MDQLSKAEFQRYSRHIIMPDIGVEGQVRLKQSKVLVVGAGGLGVPVLIYLAAAGVGRIGIVDFDEISISNLQRQVIYKSKEVGLSKAIAAQKFIHDLNPEIKVDVINKAITSHNALEILAPYDLVVDGTDNFPTRYLLNDASVLSDKALVYGSIFRFEGQVSVFNFEKNGIRGPNYRDLFPNPPAPDLVPNCAEGGVLGVLPGIVGSLQALETIKIITGIGEILSGKLLTLDTLSNNYRSFKYKRRKDNPLNGENPTIKELIDYEGFCRPVHLQEKESPMEEISVAELQKWQDTDKEFDLIDVREAYEFEISNLGGQLMPKSEIEKHFNSISRDKLVVMHCRSGKRSADTIRYLQKNHGFSNLVNLQGGLLAYSKKIDPNITIY